MFAYHRQGTRLRAAAPQVGVRLRRFAEILAVGAAILLVTVATIQAAFAREVPPPGGSYAPPRLAPPRLAPPRLTPAPHAVHTAIDSGLTGWQVALIAVGVALSAAIGSLTLDRVRAGRSASPRRPRIPADNSQALI
jgi:hypothetical protein